MSSKTRSKTPKRTFHPEIDSIHAVFLDHHSYPEMTDSMNTAYGFTNEFVEYLNKTQDAFADVGQFVPTVLDNIIEHIENNAYNTTDKTRIAMLMKDKTQLLVEIAKGKRAHVTGSNLDRALNYAPKTAQPNVLVFYINWSPFYIDERITTRNVFNFALFGEIPFPLTDPNAPAPPPSTGTTPTDPALVALFKQNNDILNKTADAIKHLAPKKVTKTPTTSITPFIPLNFSTGIKTRYDLNKIPYVFHTNDTLTKVLDVSSLPHNLRNYARDKHNSASGFVTRDGSYFVLADLGPQSEKNFRNNVNKMSGETSYELYNWYTAFTTHCARYGKYCHPYPCFRPDCNHPRGFTIGKNDSDDLHSTFETLISTDSRIIWDVLHIACTSHHKFRQIVEIYDGHGYEALKAIVCATHPFLMVSPSSLVTTRPTQGSLSLMEYWKKYNHYIMLRALIENNKQTVHDKTEREHFVSGCNHSSFLQTEIRREQDFTHLKHKFEPSNFLATLQQYLNLPNSPAIAQPSQRNQLRKLNPYVQSSKPFTPATKTVSVNQIQTIDVDDDLLDLAYSMSINQIKANPASFNKQCLVCNMMTGQTSNHTFEHCPILQQSSLLRQNFINFCQMYKRAQNTLNKANASINQVQISSPIEDTQLIIDNVADQPQSTDDAKMDFVQGGR